jgi:hypothetical protein
LRSLWIAFSCFSAFLSRACSRNSSGMIGRSSIRQRLKRSSYSSGAISSTRWPTANVTIVSSDS